MEKACPAIARVGYWGLGLPWPKDVQLCLATVASVAQMSTIPMRSGMLTRKAASMTWEDGAATRAP